MRSIKTLGDVVDWGLCTGCGACAYACKHGGISLVNIAETGIRPQFNLPDCANCTECLGICPGHEVDDGLAAGAAAANGHQKEEFGRALEIWEGHAADPEIRHHASSGGLLSALALFCLEREDMAFALHIAMDEEKPWLNRTVESRNRDQILARTGSRYAPASPCDRLEAIENSDRPCVFIGKPCDTAAVAKLRRRNPQLDEKLGLVLTFFCAGTPFTASTLEMLDRLDVKTEQVNDLNYRGEGWPGGFKVRYDDRKQEQFVPYQQAWSQLAKKRSFRCNLCPDGLGRLADLSCGDAWDKYQGNGDPGRSIVVVRSERGRRILHGAMEAGYVTLKPIGAQQVRAAQVNLLDRRKNLFGRLLGMKLLGIPTPKFTGFDLWQDWSRLPLAVKAQSILGTMRRLIRKGMWRRQRCVAREPAGG